MLKKAIFIIEIIKIFHSFINKIKLCWFLKLRVELIVKYLLI